MHQYATENPSCSILYLHTKGISYVKNPEMFKRSQDWTKYMLYALVECNPQACLEMLEGTEPRYDTIGCNYSDKPWPHYSGNFWWATGKYIASLPVYQLTDKMSAEKWLSPSGERCKQLHHSHINHFEQDYPREKYADAVIF
jgi:hypothetical protein